MQKFKDNIFYMTGLMMKMSVFLTVLYVSPGYCSDLTLQLCYPSTDASPYQVGDGESVADPPGIAVEVIASAAEDVNVDVGFCRLPNKRMKKYLKEGKIDGAFLMSYNEERKILGAYPMKGGKLDPENRVATVSYSLYKLKGDGLQWDGKKITGMGNRHIAANRNYSIVRKLKKLGVKVDETDSTVQGFRMLEKGRIAAVAVHGVTGDAIISREGFSDIEKISIPLSVKNYFLIFSHQFSEKHPDIKEKIWKSIGKIRDHKTKEVVSKYN